MKIRSFVAGLLLLLASGQSLAVDTNQLRGAVQNGLTDMVRQLIALGADVNASSDDGMTPLHWAAYYGHADVALVLIHSGANVNARDKYVFETPLHVAAKGGHAAVVRVLVASGADVNAKTSAMITDYRHSGMTPLEIARAEGKTEVVRILENAGASPAR